ncbi:MAG: immunoglobulin domain-containing protein [Verrucomicrobiales bacterium]|nr:immunoglobulin domain-containing protein [Verrucomicrobiales bacterium]
MKAKLIRLYLLSALLLGLRAFGQVEFMLNGGFESGDFTNWNLTGDDTWTIVDTGHNSGIAPRTGSYEAALGTAGSLGYLSQTVATTPGTSYLLSFWLNHSGGDPNDVFIVSWNGTTLLDETNPPAPAWTSYQFVVTATGTSTVLQFGYEAGDTDYLGLDDVSLQSQTNIAPAVTIQPVNLTVNAGQGATFSVVATGSAPIKYQWQFGGMAIAGANGSSYTIGSTVPTNAGNYSCVVSNNAGATNSVMAALTVITTPVITLQPADVTVLAGQPAAFSVTATGPQPLYYQWQFGIDGTNIVAATNATLTLNNVQPTNGGAYAVTVSNAYGAIVSSNALLTVLVLPPFITTQPTNQAVYAGDAARFTVTAGGTSPLNYQWSFNDTNLVGATNATLVLTNVQTNQAGDYFVLVTNLYGSTNSVAVTLTVNPLLPSTGLLPFPLSANQRGTVACLDNPSVNYDIYLPPAYSPNKPALPIMFAFSPSGGSQVTDFQAACSNLNIIVLGINQYTNTPWNATLRGFFAVSRDVRQRVLFDPTAVFTGGLSGGAMISYVFSRFWGQQVSGVLAEVGWLGRYNTSSTSVAYFSTDRVQTNLLVARTTGTSDSNTLFYNPYDSNYLASCGAVVHDWFFPGGHQPAPDSIKIACFQWLLNNRTPSGVNDESNSLAQAADWRARMASGQNEAVLRECVGTLMSKPRSWFSLEAQLVLDDLMTNYDSFRSLNVSNLYQVSSSYVTNFWTTTNGHVFDPVNYVPLDFSGGVNYWSQSDFASDLFYYYTRAAAANQDWQRYDCALKALNGIPGTTGDRAGDIYYVLTKFSYPAPLLHTSDSQTANLLNFWISEDAPGLAYSLQSRTNLVNDVWQGLPAPAVDTNTIWSATSIFNLESANGFYRVEATPTPASSPPWPTDGGLGP